MKKVVKQKSAKQGQKQYSRPQLVKHGKVESMTLTRPQGSSQPHYQS